MRGRQYLTQSKQYALVNSKGSSWPSDLMIMKALPNGLDYSRYGFSVGRRVGGAVVRNRVKRRMREILHLFPLEPGWDIIFIIRPQAASASFSSLKEVVYRLLLRAGLVAREYEGACLRTD